MKRVLLVLPILAAIAVAVAVQPLGSLQADGLESTGEAAAVGVLRGFVRESATPTVATFVLEATHLSVETDASDAAIWAPPVRVATPPATTSDDHSSARVLGTENRADHRWMLLPLDGRATAALSTSCAGLEASSVDAVEREVWVYPERGTLSADTRDAVVASPCRGGATLTVTGDFLLALWEWDVLVEHDGGSELMWSGRGRSQADPVGSDGTRQFVSEDRELFLFARDAVLEVDLLEGERVYLGPTTFDVAGTTILRGATGSLALGATKLDLDREDVVLSGSLQLQAQSSGGSLAVDMGGDIDRAEARGAVWFAEATPSWLWPTLLVVTVLASLWLLWLLAPLVYYAKLWAGNRLEGTPSGIAARRAEALRLGAREAEWTDHPRLALFLARLARRVHPSVKVQVMEARLYGSLGRHKKALRAFDRLDGVLGSPGDRAQNAMAAAATAAAAGQTQAQRNWKARAARYQREAALQPTPVPGGEHDPDVA